MSEGDNNMDIWVRLGKLEGRVEALERSLERVETALNSIDQKLRTLTQRMDRGTGFWAAFVIIGSLIGSLAGGVAWTMAEAEVGPFKGAGQAIEEGADR
ncbi:MAG: hypothetical protein ACLFSI_02555 [Halorhodospira sp.]